MAIRVQEQAFDPGEELNGLHAANVGVGAVVGFVGYVRDFNAGHEVAGMFLEHYPGMTHKALGKIAEEAQGRWPLLKLESCTASARSNPGSRSFSSEWPVRTARPPSRPATSSWTT
jgi:molybdopterin synthase catalytic subunit